MSISTWLPSYQNREERVSRRYVIGGPGQIYSIINKVHPSYLPTVSTGWPDSILRLAAEVPCPCHAWPKTDMYTQVSLRALPALTKIPSLFQQDNCVQVHKVNNRRSLGKMLSHAMLMCHVGNPWSSSTRHHHFEQEKFSLTYLKTR